MLVTAHLNISDNSFNINSEFAALPDFTFMHLFLFLASSLQGFRAYKAYLFLKKLYSFELPLDLTILITVISFLSQDALTGSKTLPLYKSHWWKPGEHTNSDSCVHTRVTTQWEWIEQVRRAFYKVIIIMN